MHNAKIRFGSASYKRYYVNYASGFFRSLFRPRAKPATFLLFLVLSSDNLRHAPLCRAGFPFFFRCWKSTRILAALALVRDNLQAYFSESRERWLTLLAF